LLSGPHITHLSIRWYLVPSLLLSQSPIRRGCRIHNGRQTPCLRSVLVREMPDSFHGC
jgi:hypothetical protein